MNLEKAEKKAIEQNKQEESEILAATEEFVGKHDMSADELWQAYQLMLGVKPAEALEGKMSRKELYALADLMAHGSEKGVPLNAFVELLDRKDQEEFAERAFGGLVARLDISEEEKNLLSDLVDNPRAGSIVIFDKETGDQLAKITIPKSVSEHENPSKVLASDFLKVFGAVKDAKVELEFVEH